MKAWSTSKCLRFQSGLTRHSRYQPVSSNRCCRRKCLKVGCLYRAVPYMTTIRASALSTISCEPPFHLYSHLTSMMLHPSEVSFSSAKVPAATSPPNSILIDSIHTSEYCDDTATSMPQGTTLAPALLPGRNIFGNSPSLRVKPPVPPALPWTSFPPFIGPTRAH